MRNAWIASLEDLAEDDKDLILITADLGFGVFDKFEKTYPKQYFNVGVAEQAMVGVATGLGLEGCTIFTYSIANFATLRCLEQIRNDACYHDVNLNVVANGAGFSYGQLGMSHHATEDLAIMRAIPNIEVYAPCAMEEVELITRQVYERARTSYTRLDKTFANDDAFSQGFEFGKLREVGNGVDVALIAIGGILEEAIEAKALLHNEGISASVFGCHCLKPFDIDGLLEVVKKHKAVVSIEEHNIIGGLGSVIAETCLENSILPQNFTRIGLNDRYSEIVGDQKFLRSKYKMDSLSIARRVKSLLDCETKLN